MAKRATAAVLLVSVLAWAEMALAPMLAMHAAHIRPGHEMATDMPAEHAGHHPQHGETNHACCPQAHKTISENTGEFAASAPGCTDPHSCCFRQGPQSVPAPAREPAGNDQLAKELISAVLAYGTSVSGAKREFCDSTLPLRPPAEVFGMTLRV